MLNKFKVKIKKIVFNLDIPIAGEFLIQTWNILQKLKYKIRMVQKQIIIKKIFPEHILLQKYLLLKSKDVLFYLDNEISKLQSVLKKEPKNYKEVKIDKLPEIFLIKEKIEKNIEWENSQYFDEVYKHSQFPSKEKLIKHLDTLFGLSKKIRDAREKDGKEKLIEKLKDKIKIQVLINEMGQIVLIRNRLDFSFWYFFNFKLQVEVLSRHRRWVDFKKELCVLAFEIKGVKLYQPLTHPDLQFIPSKYSETRFKTLIKNIKIRSGKLLDIGSNLGYFCHKFEDIGFDCVAIEYSSLHANILRKLAVAEDKKFKIYSVSIFNFKKNKDLKFDVVLALNIFHHFLLEKRHFEDFKILLGRLKPQILFFQSHNPKEFLYKDPYRNFKPEEFVKFILDNSCLKKYKMLKKYENGRVLYKLEV